jgi:hypothetical protein
MVLLTRAESIYPIKAKIGSDTVICSTPEQQSKYIGWKDDRDECREENVLLKEKIVVQDSVNVEQKKQLEWHKQNGIDFKKVNSNMKELNDITNSRLDKMETAFTKQVRKNNIMKLGISLGAGGLNLAVMGLLTWVVISKF